MLRLLRKSDPGIRLRISTETGVVMEASSAELYLASRVTERPGRDGWHLLIPGGPDGSTEYSTVPIKIEIRADA